ncbi:MAG: hypothetical protein HKP23_07605 [Flavobacteriaceae bacterium]|nr:hypothetical protein [Eudoraea sp.]MBT8312676.1 hypothetical protein [Eudoraea sp.]NNJ39091.1 hypothetical protein [Flavobacteriaceae bacterium]NNJ39410.1 hypothetical protein [Eudoraea sp.]
MKLFLKVLSYFFHPLLIPIMGTLSYFVITPKYSPLELQSGNILPVFILTVIIPIIVYFILRNLGVVSSIFLPAVTERKYPLFISLILLLMVLLKVIPNNYTIELYHFFLGLISATATCLLLLYINFKSSLHMMGMGTLLMFMAGLSIHFEINITIGISILTLATGLVATGRLYFKAHNGAELLIGFLIGLTSQLLTFKFWL